MSQLPTIEENPKGLHAKYLIKKFVGFKRTGFFEVYKPVFKAVDKDAEYFVLRLDLKAKDLNHVKACRIAIHSYANAIEATIPELAKDLRERYPLL